MKLIVVEKDNYNKLIKYVKRDAMLGYEGNELMALADASYWWAQHALDARALLQEIGESL